MAEKNNIRPSHVLIKLRQDVENLKLEIEQLHGQKSTIALREEQRQKITELEGKEAVIETQLSNAEQGNITRDNTPSMIEKEKNELEQEIEKARHDLNYIR